MPSELGLAYCGYLVWLTAGLCDFISHWRTDLPHTSGVAESATHLVQLGLLGAAVVLGLVFDVGPSSVLLVFALVIAHAIVGYLDTRIAFAKHRVVLPIEQHLHSVLDTAPIVAFAWWVVSTWPAAAGASWHLAPREPPVPIVIWFAVLVPAVVLCVIPAVLEFGAAWRAATRRMPPRRATRTR